MPRLIFPKIDLTNVQAVITDIDSTLYFFDPAHEKTLEECRDFFEKDFQGQFDADQFIKDYLEEREKLAKRLAPQGACRSRLFAMQVIFERMNVKQSYVKAMEYEQFYWQHFMTHMKRDEDAFRFLEACKAKNIPVCALTDMQSHFQIQKLQALKLENLIDYLVTSEEAGAEKPAKVAFQRALDKLGKDPQHVIMIGDNYEKDIVGAEKMGIKGYTVLIEQD